MKVGVTTALVCVLGSAPAGLCSGPPSATCTEACAGLTCATFVPETCNLVKATTGCECPGCRCSSRPWPSVAGERVVSCDVSRHRVDVRRRRVSCLGHAMRRHGGLRPMAREMPVQWVRVQRRRGGRATSGMRLGAAFCVAVESRRGRRRVGVDRDGALRRARLARAIEIGVGREVRVRAGTNVSLDGARSRLVATNRTRLMTVLVSASLELVRAELSGGYSDVSAGASRSG